jgi:hypothetical protein
MLEAVRAAVRSLECQVKRLGDVKSSLQGIPCLPRFQKCSAI